MVPTYLHNVFEALQIHGLVEESAPYFYDGGILYFWLKNMPEKTIAIKACQDSSEYLWIYAEAIDTEKILNRNGDEHWIEKTHTPPSAQITYYSGSIYGRLFGGLCVWPDDVGTTVEKIIETCGAGLASPEASQS